jgi:hypothetical protein
MKLVTSFENPPIPWRKFDWVALDEDQMSGVCGDPDCHCRQNLVRGWGETEEQAVVAFVRCLLAGLGIELLEEKEMRHELANGEKIVASFAIAATSGANTTTP